MPDLVSLVVISCKSSPSNSVCAVSNFKCGAGQQCQGGSTGKDGKTYAWASWSDEPPAEIMPNYVPADLVQPKSLDDITDSDTPF